MREKIHLAVIGSGISGLTVAREIAMWLGENAVTVFEKADRPGGRMASKVINGADFDYGAQFFTVKTPSLQALIDEMRAQRVVDTWCGRFIEFDHKTVCSERHWDDNYPHYVGTPNMAAIPEWLAKPLKIHYETPVTKIVKKTKGWQLHSNKTTLGLFDWLVIAIPPEQARALLPPSHQFQTTLSSIKMQPCFTLRVALSEDVDFGFIAALVRNHDISWISKNSSKHNRTAEPSVIVHSTNKWAQFHLNDDLEQIKQHLLECLQGITRIKQESIKSSDVKRWLFANAPRYSGSNHLIDYQSAIAVCGDALIHGRIEAAYKSAQHLVSDLTSEFEEKGIFAHRPMAGNSKKI